MKIFNTRLLKKWYFVTPLVIVLVIAIVFLARGWVRVTAVPKAQDIYYGRRVNNEFKKQYAALANPLESMGFSSIKHTSKCSLSSAQHFELDTICVAESLTYTDKVSSLSPSLEVRAAKLEAVLKANNWQGGNTSITQLGQNITKGIDWTPDADYTKNIGKIYCDIDFNTAFSQPKPAAIAGRMTCYRTIFILPHKS